MRQGVLHLTPLWNLLLAGALIAAMFCVSLAMAAWLVCRLIYVGLCRMKTMLLSLTMLLLPLTAHAQIAPVPVAYDVVAVRSPTPQTLFADVARPLAASKNSDLVIRKQDGTIEVLARGGNGAWADPFPSYDGKDILATYYPDQRQIAPGKYFSDFGADCWKIRVVPNADGTRTMWNLTKGVQYDLDRKACPWADDPLTKAPPVGKVSLGFQRFCIHPCPLPGGKKFAFVSSHKGFIRHRGDSPATQLCVMNEDGTGLEVVGHLHIGAALHPFVLQDGRIVVSTMQSQGLRDKRMWDLQSIWPDGREWGPVVSAFTEAVAFHFAGQLTSGDIVTEAYYNMNDYGAGTFFRLPPTVPQGFQLFGSADPLDARNILGIRFTPYQFRLIIKFADWRDNPAKKDAAGVFMGKVTTPAGAPGGHLLCSWSGGPMCSNMPPGQAVVPPNYGVYLIPNGEAVDHPSRMRPMIPPDPAYNYLQPRPLVPYMQLAGMAEPKALPWNPNDGSIHPALPAGTTKGMIGSSSTEAEAYPNGKVYPGERMARWNGFPPTDTTKGLGPKDLTNYYVQGGTGGLFTTDDLVAIRIVGQRPSEYRNYGSPNKSSQIVGRPFVSHANEVMENWGEVPIRKFTGGKQPLEPGADPKDPKARKDTSWEALVPANRSFTFQAITRRGNAALHSGTWHQVRPGERRHNCGGCHTHSETAIRFEDTAANLPTYTLLDLTAGVPLVTTKDRDKGGRQLAEADDVGLRFADAPVCPEWLKDIRPMIQAKCITCHGETDPKGGLVLNRTGDKLIASIGVRVPLDYYVLAWDVSGEFGKFQPEGGFRRASRYVMKLNSMGSLLNWKCWNERTDGFANGVRGDGVDFGQGCKAHEVLTVEEKYTFGLWIDLGCLYRMGK